MYWINKQNNSRYNYALISIHDRTRYEVEDFPTLTDAIKALKRDASIINDHEISVSDITFSENCYKESIPLRKLDDSPAAIMERVLKKLPEHYQPPVVESWSSDPERNFIYQSARYLPKLLQMFKELEMIIHDLQEESSAAREAIRYKNRAMYYENTIIQVLEQIAKDRSIDPFSPRYDKIKELLENTLLER